MARFVTSALKSIREQIAPVRKESGFLEQGVLTPEEFVAAGDQLVFRCQTWTWEAGDPKKRRNFLPADKQYLVTRNVPCHRRASAFEKEYAEETEVDGGGEEGWLATHRVLEGEGSGQGADAEDAFQTLSAGDGSLQVAGNVAIDKPVLQAVDEHFHIGKDKSGSGLQGGAAVKPSGEEDEYADIATFEDENILENDEATLQPSAYIRAEEPVDSILATRTYDISITYDKYYQTPKVFLFGYDEEQVFEDIMQDYAQRTVTFERHPHLEEMHASIHPCQHAKVMSRIVENLRGGGGNVPRIDQYLFIFLKFVQSVIPTIEYDFTMEIQASADPVLPSSST